MGEQVLGAARQVVDAGPFQAGAEAAGKAGPEVAPMQRDALEARLLHRRQQFAARRFDFGQFRQSLEHTRNRPQRALASHSSHNLTRLLVESLRRTAACHERCASFGTDAVTTRRRDDATKKLQEHEEQSESFRRVCPLAAPRFARWQE